jgi:phage terminase small subunit
VNHRQRRFANEYLIDADRRAAAIRAGYRAGRAVRQGSELMHNPEVAYAVAMAQRARSLRTGITKERVLVELARIAFADLARIVTWSATHYAVTGLGDDDAAAVAELSASERGGGRIAVRLHDKSFALESLARYCGLYENGPGDAAPSGRDRLRAVLRPYLEAMTEEGTDEG